MADIFTNWESVRGDWVLSGADLARGSDLVTAVLISLFTDRVSIPDDEIPDGGTDPRGWWGDAAIKPIGSRLWLISRAKQSQQTLGLARGYIREALQWLIDDGVASRIESVLTWSRAGTLSAEITVYAPESAAYGPEPVARLGAGNVFALGSIQAWGWDVAGDVGAWVAITPSAREPITDTNFERREISGIELREDGSRELRD